MRQSFPEIVTEIREKNNVGVTEKFVYHYTDGKSLQSIVEEKELWLSERGFMNDILDQTYVADLVKAQFKGIVPLQGSQVERSLFEKMPQYVFSTSLEKDLIHQWAYYSNTDAYCIEFDRHTIQSYLYGQKMENDSYYFGPVIYEREKALRILSQTIEAYRDKILEMFDSHSYDPKKKEIRETAKDVYQYFFSLIKQPGHYCEKEYRFVLKTDRDPSFRVRNGLFVPFIKIANPEKKLPISKIMIGPNNHEEIAASSLRRFLDLHGYKSVRIERSELKIRGSK